MRTACLISFSKYASHHFEKLLPRTALHPRLGVSQLSGSPLSPDQIAVITSCSPRWVRFRYSPNSYVISCALTPIFAQSAWIISAIRRGLGFLPGFGWCQKLIVNPLDNPPPQARPSLSSDHAARPAGFCHMTIETAASERRPVVRGLQRRFEGALFYRWPCRARAAPVRHSAVYAKRYRPVCVNSGSARSKFRYWDPISIPQYRQGADQR